MYTIAWLVATTTIGYLLGEFFGNSEQNYGALFGFCAGFMVFFFGTTQPAHKDDSIAVNNE